MNANSVLISRTGREFYLSLRASRTNSYYDSFYPLEVYPVKFKQSQIDKARMQRSEDVLIPTEMCIRRVAHSDFVLLELAMHKCSNGQIESKGLH